MLPFLDPDVFNLTIEQQFKLEQIKIYVKQLGREELEQLVLDLTQHIDIKNNVMKTLIKQL
jgi:hypothetical protein